jgi:AcrR family transcriptional regulator
VSVKKKVKSVPPKGMAPMKTIRRHKAEGGYRRGEATRERIIKTALALFGEKGFEGVSTREIAAKANVPPPSLQYYFGSKRGLYIACVEHIQSTGTQAVEPALAAGEKLLETDATPAGLIDAYCALLDALADFLLSGTQSASQALFISRYMAPDDWPAKPEGKVWKTLRLQACFTAFVARIAQRSPEEEEIRLIVTAINGQLLTLYLAQRHLKNLTNWDRITPKRLGTLKRLFRRHATILLNAYKPKPQ